MLVVVARLVVVVAVAAVVIVVAAVLIFAAVVNVYDGDAAVVKTVTQFRTFLNAHSCSM